MNGKKYELVFEEHREEIDEVLDTHTPVVDGSAAAVTQVWAYIGELIFNMLVLVGSVKMADRIVREMMGL